MTRQRVEVCSRCDGAGCKTCRNRDRMRAIRAAGTPPVMEGVKTCTKCGESKSVLEFHVQKGTKDGRYPSCRKCHRATADATYWKYAERYKANARERYDPEKAAERWAKYSATNREALNEKSRAWHQANKERDAENWRKWQTKNLEYNRERTKRYYAANREIQRAKARERYRANREQERARYDAWVKTEAGMRSRRARAVRRWARQKNAPGFSTTAQIWARVEYYGGKCWMCGAKWEHIDHVIPLSKGGSNWPANLRPACAFCNLSKHDKKIAI